jgi:hypothetical protein
MTMACSCLIVKQRNLTLFKNRMKSNWQWTTQLHWHVFKDMKLKYTNTQLSERLSQHSEATKKDRTKYFKLIIIITTIEKRYWQAYSAVNLLISNMCCLKVAF